MWYATIYITYCRPSLDIFNVLLLNMKPKNDQTPNEETKLDDPDGDL